MKKNPSEHVFRGHIEVKRTFTIGHAFNHYITSNTNIYFELWYPNFKLIFNCQRE